ncbi:MAG TPA: ABC transporter permease, partial [Ignavibacteriales bacterium]|nr:ABC transporter permease [Ignavibacteriales bacterium]
MRNNLKFAFRYLWRNKTSSLLNIAGLSLGITSALLIFLYIRAELSYDTFHAKKDRIYRVGISLTRDGETHQNGAATLALKQVLEEKFPQVEKEATTFYIDNTTFIVDPQEGAAPAKKFRQQFNVAYVPPSFYEIFDFKWAIGDYKKVLSEPNGAAVSKTIAEKFFGVKDGNYSKVIGHTLLMANQLALTVKGVIENPPKNSDFPFDIVISQVTHFNDNKGLYGNWGVVYSSTNHYVLLKQGASRKEFDEQLKAFSKKQLADDLSPGTSAYYFSQPLNDLHFNADMGNYNLKTADKKTLYALGIIGIFLIITACVNFINLSTAQAVKRSKEVGIKKTLGAGRAFLFSSFMQEIALIVVFSAVLSIAIAEIITPVISGKLELGIEYNSLTDFSAFGFLALISVVTMVLAGSYPSFLMSKAAPIKAMRGGLSGGSNKSGILLRRFLVVFQFVLSQALIVCALVISGQIEFFRVKDLGFNKDLIMLVDIPNGGLKQRDYLYNSFAN